MNDATRVQMLWANFEKAVAIADPSTRRHILKDLLWAREKAYPAASVMVADAVRLYLEEIAASLTTGADIFAAQPGSLFRYVGDAYGRGFSASPDAAHLSARMLVKARGEPDVYGEGRNSHSLVTSVYNLGDQGFRKYVLALKSEEPERFVPLLLGVVVLDIFGEVREPEPRYSIVAWRSPARATDSVIATFKREVESGSLWRLFDANEGERRPQEPTLQYLFELLLNSVAERFDIAVAPQSNHGAGNVDLCISRGAKDACCVELKWASHPKLKSGLTRQLPAYMRSRGTRCGRYVVVCRAGDPPPDQVAALLEEERRKLDPELEVSIVVVDACPRSSASRL